VCCRTWLYGFKGGASRRRRPAISQHRTSFASQLGISASRRSTPHTPGDRLTPDRRPQGRPHGVAGAISRFAPPFDTIDTALKTVRARGMAASRSRQLSLDRVDWRLRRSSPRGACTPSVLIRSPSGPPFTDRAPLRGYRKATKIRPSPGRPRSGRRENPRELLATVLAGR
jgi:hypothetical protein